MGGKIVNGTITAVSSPASEGIPFRSFVVWRTRQCAPDATSVAETRVGTPCEIGPVQKGPDVRSDRLVEEFEQ